MKDDLVYSLQVVFHNYDIHYSLSIIHYQPMLRELRLTQNDSSGIRKRWFQDDYFDLFTWQELTGKVTSFQLCYDRLGRERVISWDSERGFGHHLVDDGESSPHKNMSPVFVIDGPFYSQEVIPKFVQASHQISETIRTFTMQKLIEYVEQQANN